MSNVLNQLIFACYKFYCKYISIIIVENESFPLMAHKCCFTVLYSEIVLTVSNIQNYHRISRAGRRIESFQ